MSHSATIIVALMSIFFKNVIDLRPVILGLKLILCRYVDFFSIFYVKKNKYIYNIYKEESREIIVATT